MESTQCILYPLLGYLCGSLPFSVWITRLIKGVDVRAAGSGHATATNTIRQAGFGWGALVMVLDIAKGFFPIWLALNSLQASYLSFVLPFTAAFTVIGHCWPVFAQFRGGMGLACLGGALLAVNPLDFLTALAVLIFLVLIIRHGARASVVLGLMLAPLFWITGRAGLTVSISAASGLVIAARFLIDWNRKYKELWLDRNKSS
jgi:glycerol-3-phosphate acyltransferase PlsY